jgi:ribosomal protein S4
MERSPEERLTGRLASYQRTEFQKGPPEPPQNDWKDKPDSPEKKKPYGYQDNADVIKKLERLMEKLEQLEKLQTTEAALVKRIDLLLDKMESKKIKEDDDFNQEDRDLVRDKEKTPVEDIVKKWLGMARVSGKVLVVVAENLERILDAIMKARNEQIGTAVKSVSSHGDGEQLDLAALLSAINNVLRDLSTNK